MQPEDFYGTFHAVDFKFPFMKNIGATVSYTTDTRFGIPMFSIGVTAGPDLLESILPGFDFQYKYGTTVPLFNPSQQP